MARIPWYQSYCGRRGQAVDKDNALNPKVLPLTSVAPWVTVIRHATSSPPSPHPARSSPGDGSFCFGFFNIRGAKPDPRVAVLPSPATPSAPSPARPAPLGEGQGPWLCGACVCTCVRVNGGAHLLRVCRRSAPDPPRISDLLFAALAQMTVITMPHIHMLLTFLTVSGFLVSLFPKA